MKIQINSLAAFERLIGGDTEVEIEIRNSIVQKFAERYLKPLANSELFKDAFQSIKAKVTTQAMDLLSEKFGTFEKTWNDQLVNVKLRPEIKSIIVSEVESKLHGCLHKAVTETIETWKNNGAVERVINDKVAYFTKEYIGDEIKKRLEKVKNQLQ